jgi:hypothetical protein
VDDRFVPAVDARSTFVYAADAGRLRITGHRGYGPRTIARLDVPLDTDLTPVDHILRSGVPAFFPDRGERTRACPGATVVGRKQAWAFLALVVSDRRVGRASVYWTTSPCSCCVCGEPRASPTRRQPPTGDSAVQPPEVARPLALCSSITSPL